MKKNDEINLQLLQTQCEAEKEDFETFKMNKTCDDSTIKVHQTPVSNCDTSYNTIIELDSSVNTMVINDSDEDFDEDDASVYTESVDDSTIRINNAASNSNTFIKAEPSAPTMLFNNGTIANQNEFMKNFQFNKNESSAQIDIQNEVKLFENDVSFINKFSVNEIEDRLKLLDIELAKEIEILSKKYELKRKPIMDAIEMKKKKPQIF